MKRPGILISVFMSVLTVAMGCTRTLPYKEELRTDNTVEKSSFPADTEYLMVSSMLEASRTSDGARPFAMSEGKRVKFRITSNSLQVYELDNNGRFQSNPTNNKIVLEIPVTHVDYDCKKDRHGECTGEETEVNDIDWSHKTKMKMDFSTMADTLPMLPLELEQALGFGCYSKLSTRVLSHEINGSDINIKVERTYRTNLVCLMGMAAESGDFNFQLGDLITSAVFHYSMTRADTLASVKYNAIEYPRDDQNTFGFFTTDVMQEDVDNRPIKDSEKSLLNRWNPEREKVVYHLSADFYKPENASLKKATLEAIDKINQGLKEAGVKFQIDVDQSTVADVGNIRQSAVVLVDDPSAASILGYGPSVADPKTGEIVSARTVMYAGTLKKYLRFLYEEARKQVQAGKSEKSTEKEAQLAETNLAGALKNSLMIDQFRSQSQKIHGLKKFSMAPTRSISGGSNTITSPAQIKQVQNFVQRYTQNVDRSANSIEVALAKQEQCYFTVDQMTFGKTIQRVLSKTKVEDLKPWADLSADEKQMMIDLILPEVWVPVLTHELGHNLGLRHNFSGSEDKENFYTDEELKAKGVDFQIPRSTVMEYTGSEFRSLPTLGKYDIAALRFGYQRQVEGIDKETQKIRLIDLGRNSLKTVNEKIQNGDLKNLTIKNYKFCTDDHVGINAGCKRFDEGVTYTEMAKFMIQDYHDRYAFRNFRIDALNFSLMGDGSYAGRIDSTFRELRLFLEITERISQRFHVTLDNPVWQQVEFLKDLRQAAVISANFFLEVLTTPDVSCVAKIKGKDQTLSAPLVTFANPPLSCLQVDPEQLSEQVELIGEFGKHFSSKKDPNSDNPYADQIDVRGIWIDKALAAKYLFARVLNSPLLDEGHLNYLDLPELVQPVLSTVSGMILNNIEKDVDVTLKDGSKKKMPFAIELFETHVIPKPLVPSIAKALKMPYRNARLQEVLVNNLVEESAMAEQENPGSLQGMDRRKLFGVKRVNADDNNLRIPEGSSQIRIDDTLIVATPQNLVAKNMLDAMNAVIKLSGLDRQKLIEIAMAREAGQNMPDDASADEKYVWSMDMNVLVGFLLGQLREPQFYMTMLSILPNN